MKKKITYGQNVYNNDEINSVINLLKKTTQLGKNCIQFEKKISKMFGKDYGLMLNSGTSALFLAIESMNIPKGSEVVTPVLTFGTTVSSILKNDLVPVFVDINPKTLCIDTNLIEEKITGKTRLFCIPDLIGNVCEWDKIKRLAKKYNLKIVHDSADTLGSYYNKKPTGYYSDVTITSFYGSHIISGAGNGGMLCTNDKNIYNNSKLLRSWGRSSSLFSNSESIKNRFNIKLDKIDYDAKFIFSKQGYQLEPSEISAVFALTQLKKFKKFSKLRNRNFNLHLKFFKKLPKYFDLPIQYKNVKTNWLAYPLLIRPDSDISRKKLQIFLEKKQIQTRVIFTGNILRQPGFKNIKCVGKKNDFPNADHIMKNGILIGSHQGLNVEDIKYIHQMITLFLSKNKNQ